MKRLILVFVVIVQSIFVLGQDIHFSQYNASPLNLNPALTGLNSCNYRLALNAKMQYGGSSESLPFVYNTFGLSYDMSLAKKNPYNNFAGFGINLFSDISGDLNYGTHAIDIFFAYHIILDRYGYQSLSFGISGGGAFRTFDPSKSTFNSQFVRGSYDPSVAGEIVDRNNFFYPDLGAGALWNMKPSKKSNVYAGVAIDHANMPKQSVFLDREDRLYLKLAVHAGGMYMFTEQIGILPSVLYYYQGPSNEVNVGTYIRYKFSTLPKNEDSFYIGAWTRFNNQADALILGARVDYSGLNIGFTYDVNIDKIKTGTKLNGGPELSIIYSGCFRKGNKTLFCPVM